MRQTLPNVDYKFCMVRGTFAPGKIIGPTTCLVFQRILTDTITMAVSLPSEKLDESLPLLEFWTGRKKFTKRELLFLIGKLSFAAKVIPSGRTFIKRLIELSTTVQQLDHHISLNRKARADIDWWIKFLPEWNGKACILEAKQSLAPDIKLFTDASGQIGFVIYHEPHWVAELRPSEGADFSIEWKELSPILIAFKLWGVQWKGKRCCSIQIIW